MRLLVLALLVEFNHTKSDGLGMGLLRRQSKVETSGNAAGLFVGLGAARSHGRIGQHAYVRRTDGESGCRYINRFKQAKENRDGCGGNFPRIQDFG